MTYWGFHLVFIVPVIALLALAAWRTKAVGRAELAWLGGIALIALLYTTPWDNYLVARGVWWYSDDRVLATIGYVPVEEYLFFLLQPILSGLWLFLLLARMPPKDHAPPRWSWGVAVGACVALAVLGVALLQSESGLYLGLILVWATPVLALQVLVGWGTLWRYRSTVVWAVAVPTVYLWICDRIAIGLGVWQISERYTTGLGVGGLPIEEAVFFLITNVMVVQGLVLFRLPLWRHRMAPAQAVASSRSGATSSAP